jgi:hypothetical protein
MPAITRVDGGGTHEVVLGDGRPWCRRSAAEDIFSGRAAGAVTRS